MKKIKAFWASLDSVETVSKRELFLGLVTCVLAGYVLGTIFCPKKTTIIGSNNGNGRIGLDNEDADGQPEEE